MKRTLCTLLAVVLLLCGCDRASHAADTTDTSPHQQTPQTDTETTTMDTVQFPEGTLTVPSVRYKRDVSKTTMENDYTTAYLKEQNLHLVTEQYDGDSGQYDYTLTVMDASGGTAQTVVLPKVEGHMAMQHAYVLPDGRYFLVYYREIEQEGNVHFDTETAVFVIVSADGAVQYSTEVTDIVFLDAMLFDITQREDGSLRIFASDAAAGYYFDETLTLLQKIAWGKHQEEYTYFEAAYLHAVGDGEYHLYNAVGAGLAVNAEDGSIRTLTLPIPDGYPEAEICVDNSGGLYILTSDGLFAYQDEAQTWEFLYTWADAGVNLLIPEVEDFWILDGSTVLYAEHATSAGRDTKQITYAVLAMTDIIDSQSIVICCPKYIKDPWLERAVMQFNTQHPEYTVEINYVETDASELQEQLQSMVLEEDVCDMLLYAHGPSIKTLYDKNVFLDLAPALSDQLLTCVNEAYQVNGKLYTLPVSMSISTLVSNSAAVDVPLTWEKLYELTENLMVEQVLITDPACIPRILENAVMDFVDLENRTAAYDTDAFRVAVEYLAEMEQYTNPDAGVLGWAWDDITMGQIYCVTNGSLVPRLRDNGAPLLYVPMEELSVFPALKLIYGDTPYTLCGYPSQEGGGVSVESSRQIVVRADTNVPDGCITFLAYLLSDEMQSSYEMVTEYLPVTLSGMAGAIDNMRYSYYYGSEFETLGQNVTTEKVRLYAEGYMSEYIDNFGFLEDTSYYTVLTLTDDDKQAILDFFENCHMRSNIDGTVRAIVEEELSAWESGVRPLDETTEIIQSRVWIYLNE